MLRHFGSEGWIEFELNPSPQPGDMTVLGSMHYTQRPVSLVQRAAFGVAGVAAEVMAFENDITPTEIYQYIQTDYIEPSETDWELIGGHIGRAVPLAHAVLTAHWDDFQTEASVYLRNWAGRLGVDMRAHPFFAGP